MRVLAAVIDRHGPPAEVVRLEEQELCPPGPGEVRVGMRCASLDPADVNLIEGSYGRRPGSFPAICGHQGAGVVEEVGAGVTGLQVGQWVRPVPGVGAWRQGLVCREDELWPLPGGLDDAQAASLSVNPATAWRLLHDVVTLERGDWVLQDAGSSAVGHAVIQLCRHLGLRSLSLVRREEVIEELRGEGADLVVTALPSREELARLTDGAPLRLGLDAVGGASGLALGKALAPGGTLVCYGAMSRRPVEVPASLLIFRDLRVRGFWMTAWYERASRGEIVALLEELGALTRAGVLRLAVDRRYPLSAVQAALAHAQQGGRRGKVLLTLDPAGAGNVK